MHGALVTEGIRAQVTLAEITPAAVTQTSDVTRKQVQTDFLGLVRLFNWDIQSGCLSISTPFLEALLRGCFSDGKAKKRKF